MRRADSSVGRVSFGQQSGGVLCQRCRAGKRQIVSVSVEVLESAASLGKEQGPWADDEAGIQTPRRIARRTQSLHDEFDRQTAADVQVHGNDGRLTAGYVANTNIR